MVDEVDHGALRVQGFGGDGADGGDDAAVFPERRVQAGG